MSNSDQIQKSATIALFTDRDQNPGMQPLRLTSIAMPIFLFLFSFASLVLLLRENGTNMFGEYQRPFFPGLLDWQRNIHLFFSGYLQGYWRSVMGFTYFVVQLLCILAVGKTALRFILPGGHVKTNVGIAGEWALSYFIGAVLASLLLLLLGLVGILKFPVIFTLQIAGACLFGFELAKLAIEMPNFHELHTKFKTGNVGVYELLATTVQRYFAPCRQLSVSDKIPFLGLVFILGLLSTTAILWQHYSDVYQIHLPLAGIYAQTGKIEPNPFMLYSYFPQNTEMLAACSLLLKSEVAAILVVWGYLASTVVLLWAFLKRYVSSATSAAAGYLFLSIPLVHLFGTTLKNDFPCAAFLIASSCALAVAFDQEQIDSTVMSRWIFLSGLLCGGAFGHKLTVVVPFAITAGYLAALALKPRPSHPQQRKLWMWWTAGFLLTASPWLLRSWILTGDPIYPYMGLTLVRPWHNAAELGQSAGSGLTGLAVFVRNLIGINEHGALAVPHIGPAVVCLLFAGVLMRNGNRGLKLSLILSLTAWLCTMFLSLESRYHIGYFAFIIPALFALNVDPIYRRGGPWKKFLVCALVLVVLQTFHQTKIALTVKDALHISLFGFTPGNLKSGEREMDDLRWIGHLINTRTNKSDAVLFAGMTYGYGVERKILFGNFPDKEFIHDLAEQCADSEELHDRIRSLGVQHILINLERFMGLMEPGTTPSRRISVQDMKKIDGFISKYTVQRAVSSGGKIFWFSLKDSGPQSPIILTADDAREYPYAFYATAISYKNSDPIKEKEMLNTMLNVPLIKRNREKVLKTITDEL